MNIYVCRNVNMLHGRCDPAHKKKKLGFGRVPVSIYVIALHDMFADYI